MPPKVDPEPSEFHRFAVEMRHMEFRQIGGLEFRKTFQRLGLRAPRPRSGRETGFVFTANQLEVCVWTTWIEKVQAIREIDAGWVLIKDNRRKKPDYFAGPFNRTKNFLVNLLRYSWLARWRSIHRPLCPECHQFMTITFGRALKSRYWSCVNRKQHLESKQNVNLGWDHGLPPRAKKFVESVRKRRANYLKKLREKGKPHHLAMRRRKTWTITRPQNL